MGSRWFGSGIVRNTAGFIKVTGFALLTAILCSSCSENDMEVGWVGWRGWRGGRRNSHHH